MKVATQYEDLYALRSIDTKEGGINLYRLAKQRDGNGKEIRVISDGVQSRRADICEAGGSTDEK